MGTSFRESLRIRDANGHFTRANLCVIYCKFTGKMPHAPATTSIKHRALTVTVRTLSVWPHCLGKKNKIARPNSLPLLSTWGVHFFLGGVLVCRFFVSCFLLRCCFLKGWQNNTEVKDQTLCRFCYFRGCELALGSFIVCFRFVVPFAEK